MRIKNKKNKIISKKIHLIFNLLCNLIININILKLNNVII